MATASSLPLRGSVPSGLAIIFSIVVLVPAEAFNVLFTTFVCKTPSM